METVNSPLKELTNTDIQYRKPGKESIRTSSLEGADIVEDIPPNKGTDTSLNYSPVDKSFSEKLAECSFTSTVSQRTSDSSFRSAVSRLKTADDTDTTADFESAGEEDFSGLEQQRFPPDCASSDLWFQSLEYYNGTTTPVVNSSGRGLPGDVTLSPELNTRDYDFNDITLRPNSVESSPRSILDRTDISTAEQAPISSFGSSTPIKSPCHTTDAIEEPNKIILESPSNVTVNLLPQLNCDTQPACDKIHLVETSIEPIINIPILNEFDILSEKSTNKSHELNAENSQSKIIEFLNNSDHSSVNNSASNHNSQSEKSNFQFVTNFNESVINNSLIIESSLSEATNAVQNLDNKPNNLVDNQLDDLISQLSGLNIKNDSLIINDNQISRDCSLNEIVENKNSCIIIDKNPNNKQDSCFINENCNEQDTTQNVNGASSIYLNNCEEISEDTNSVYQEGSNLNSEFINPDICLQGFEPNINFVANGKEQLNSVCSDIDLTLDKSYHANLPCTITKPEFIIVPSNDKFIVSEDISVVENNIANVNELNCSKVQNEIISDIKSETLELSSVINKELLEVNKVEESVTLGINTAIEVEIQEDIDIPLVNEGSEIAFKTEDSPSNTTIVEGEISAPAIAATEPGVQLFDINISPTKVEVLKSNDAVREVKLIDISFSSTEDKVQIIGGTEIDEEKHSADKKVDISYADRDLNEVKIKFTEDSISVTKDKVAEIEIANLEEFELLEVVSETEVEAAGIKLVAEEQAELLKFNPLLAEETQIEVVGIKEAISPLTVPDEEIVEVQTNTTDVEKLKVLEVSILETEVDEAEIKLAVPEEALLSEITSPLTEVVKTEVALLEISFHDTEVAKEDTEVDAVEFVLSDTNDPVTAGSSESDITLVKNKEKLLKVDFTSAEIVLSEGVEANVKDILLEAGKEHLNTSVVLNSLSEDLNCTKTNGTEKQELQNFTSDDGTISDSTDQLSDATVDQTVIVIATGKDKLNCVDVQSVESGLIEVINDISEPNIIKREFTVEKDNNISCGFELSKDIECNNSGLTWIVGNRQNEQLEGTVVPSAESFQSNSDPFLMLDDVKIVLMDSSETCLNVMENTVHDKSEIEIKSDSISLKKQSVRLLEEKTADFIKTGLSFDETFLTAGDISLTDPPADIGMDTLIGNFQGLGVNDISNRSVSMIKEGDVSARVENSEHDGDNLSDISSTGSPPDLLNNMTEEEMADLLCTSRQHLSHGAGGDLLNLSFNNLRSYHPPDSTFLDMKPLDLNTTEAGPVTASDDVQAGELNQVISETDMDIATLKRRVEESDQNNQSLLNNFDPLSDLSVNTADNQHNDSLFGTLKERVEVVETTPIKEHHVGLLVPVTPLPDSESQHSPSTPHTMPDGAGPITPKLGNERRITDTVRSPMQEALAKELSKLQDAMMERQRVHEMRLMEVKMKVQEAEKKREMKLARLKELEARQPLHVHTKVENLTADHAHLKEENSTLQKRTVELLGVLEGYEKALPRLLNQREAKKKVMMDEVRSLLSERNTAQQHVANMETALNDIHQKYERSVKSIEEYKLGQEKKVVGLTERSSSLETAKEKYLKLLAHATQRLEDTNSDRNTMLRSHETEVARIKGIMQQKELKIRSNNVTIEQKQKELKEMTKIYDELLRKLN